MSASAYPFNIVAVAALLRNGQDDPVFVVRWALGDAGTELPRADDIFDVEVKLDGVVVATAEASPMNYAMLDPGRVEHLFPEPGAGRKWMVAGQPTGPIDPAASDEGDLTKSAIGVIHLLQPTSTPRLRVRAGRVLLKAFEQIVATEPALATLSRVDMVESAIMFVDALIRANVPAAHLPVLLRTEFKALLADSTGVSLLAMTGSQVRRFSHAALVTQALAMPYMLEQLAEVIDESLQVRSHIRYSALSGGTMIDYWNDPFNTGVPPEEGGRGKAWPSAELLGLGCRIVVPTTVVEDAIASQAAELTVRVTHRERNFVVSDLSKLASANLADVDEVFLDSDRRTFHGFDAPPLNCAEFRRGFKLGSSHPPQPPAAAYIDHGMLRVALAKRPNEEQGEPSVGFRSGDSKIEIVITKPGPAPFAGPDARTNTAYNVYGVWEGAPGFDAYFSDPDTQPTLDELRPWLMTRRYSFAKDLQLAFPDLNGRAHPALQEAMVRPAWHSLLLRPDHLQDETSADITPLPDVGAEGDAVFTFDLRTAMALPAGDRGPLGWDMSAPMHMDWRPELDRELHPVGAKPARGQRYRFWVSAVDPFEQESEPLPVQAADPDAGEAPTWLFAPRRRTPLLAPPGDEIGCTLTASGQLEIAFSTPSESQASGRDVGKLLRVDSASLSATVVVFRRLLVLDKNQARMMASASILPEHPRWQAFARELEGERWRLFDTVTLNSPVSGDKWKAVFPIGPDGLGWEYLAAANFSVKPAYAGYWGPSISHADGGGRCLTLVSPDASGKYVRTYEKVEDMPAVSAVAKAKPLLVSDSKQPWWPTVTALVIHAAKPVLAPPQTRRDLILQRLLDRSVAQGENTVPRRMWGEALLTEGQVTMAEAALDRTISQNSSLPPVGDAALADARRLLARDLLDPGANVLRQHATIGFRGLAELTWTYTPRSRRPASDQGKFAEAAAFRIYGISVPTAKDDRERYATLGGQLTFVANKVYRIAIDKGSALEWATIGSRPTVLVMVNSAGTRILADVLRAFVDGGVNCLELAAADGQVLPATGRAHLFAAQPIDDVLSDGIDASSSYRYFVPVPGGAAAWFAWWVSALSATGREAEKGNLSPMRSVILPRTVEPPPPPALYAFQPTDNNIHFLDPQANANWMPSKVCTVRDAKYLPRTVVAWRSPVSDPVDKLKLLIERRERAVAQPANARMLALAPLAWEAIKRIESLVDGDPIQLDDLSALADWLAGEPVDAPALPADGDIWRVFDAHDPLPLDGVVDLPAAVVAQHLKTGDKLSAWIDYFGRNGNSDGAMDGNWDFQYRLRTFIDLESGRGDQRYLFSAATPWTEFVHPETPAIRVKPLLTEHKESKLSKARVKFAFDTPLTSLLRASLASVDAGRTWEYRIVLRRKLESPSISEQKEIWIDVGKPLVIAFHSARMLGELAIIDDEVDRRWSGDVPKLTYRVFVQQFLRTDDGSGPVEKLIRAYNDDSGKKDIIISLEAPRASQSEVEMIQTMEIT